MFTNWSLCQIQLNSTYLTEFSLHLRLSIWSKTKQLICKIILKSTLQIKNLYIFITFTNKSCFPTIYPLIANIQHKKYRGKYWGNEAKIKISNGNFKEQAFLRQNDLWTLFANRPTVSLPKNAWLGIQAIRQLHLVFVCFKNICNKFLAGDLSTHTLEIEVRIARPLIWLSI